MLAILLLQVIRQSMNQFADKLKLIFKTLRPATGQGRRRGVRLWRSNLRRNIRCGRRSPAQYQLMRLEMSLKAQEGHDGNQGRHPRREKCCTPPNALSPTRLCGRRPVQAREIDLYGGRRGGGQ